MKTHTNSKSTLLGLSMLLSITGVLTLYALQETDSGLLTAESTTSNTGCYGWRDPCFKKGNWVSKCSLAPRIDRLECSSDDCRIGDCDTPYEEEEYVPVSRGVERGVRRGHRIHTGYDKETDDDYDPIQRSGCYFWFDPCSKDSATCAPLPRIIHVACDDVKCNVGSCTDVVIEKGESVVDVDLQDFNGDGVVNSDDEKLRKEIKQDVHSTRTVPKKDELVRAEKRDRFTDGCFMENGFWSDTYTDCAEDQEQFLWKLYFLESGDMIADVSADDDDSVWEEQMHDELFEEKKHEQRVEILHVIGKALYRFAVLAERTDLHDSFTESLIVAKQEVSDLYQYALDDTDLTTKELEGMVVETKQQLHMIETLLENQQWLATVAQTDEPTTEDVVQSSAPYELPPELYSPHEEDYEYHGPKVEIDSILEETADMFEKVVVVFEIYEEAGITVPPAALEAYEEAKAFYEVVSVECEQSPDTCFRLWDIYRIMERMEGPMVSALYASGDQATIERVEALFREEEEEREHEEGPTLTNEDCDFISGNSTAQEMMREHCEEVVEEEEEEQLHGGAPEERERGEDVRWYWTIEGERHEVADEEDCEELAGPEGWSDQELHWCLSMFRDYEDGEWPDEWPEDGGTMWFWDAAGNRYDVEDMNHCEELAVDHEWSDEEKRWCLDMFGYDEDVHYFRYGDGYEVDVRSEEDCRMYHVRYVWTGTELQNCLNLFNTNYSLSSSSSSRSSRSSSNSSYDYSYGYSSYGYSSYGYDPCSYGSYSYSSYSYDPYSSYGYSSYGYSSYSFYPYYDYDPCPGGNYSSAGFEFRYGGDSNYGVWVTNSGDCQMYHDRYQWTSEELSQCLSLFSSSSSSSSSSSNSSSAAGYPFYTSNGTLYHVEYQSQCDEFASSYNWSETDKQWCRSMFGGGTTSYGASSYSYGNYSSYSYGNTGQSYYWSQTTNQSYPVSTESDCQALVDAGTIPASEYDWCVMAFQWNSSYSGYSNMSYSTSTGCFYTNVYKEGSPIGYTVHCTTSGTDCRYGSATGDPIDMTGVELGTEKNCY